MRSTAVPSGVSVTPVSATNWLPMSTGGCQVVPPVVEMMS